MFESLPSDQLRRWCNGNIGVSKTLAGGSIPSRRARKEDMTPCGKCIECGKTVYRDDVNNIEPWFCGEWCAGACKMFSVRAGTDRSPEAALEKLTLRHLERGDPKDLKRIEAILEKLTTVK